MTRWKMSKKSQLAVLTFALFCFVSRVMSADAPLVMNLWPGAAPDEIKDVGPERVRMSPALTHQQVEVTNSTRMITGVTKPTITIQRPTQVSANGTAMLIFPGGGYWDLYWQLEGEEVADWLNSLGIIGVIVKYRVPRQPDEPEREPARRPLQDAQRALRIVRRRAMEWGIDPKRIGTIGFSAGGHLSMAMATNFEKPAYQLIDDLDKISCRPDFAIAAYSGYLKPNDKDELAPGLEVPTNAPPVFLVHGGDDIISPPDHSVVMYLALRKAGIPAELHIYAGATHDFGVRRSERPFGQWTDACVRWLRDRAFFKK